MQVGYMLCQKTESSASGKPSGWRRSHMTHITVACDPALWHVSESYNNGTKSCMNQPMLFQCRNLWIEWRQDICTVHHKKVQNSKLNFQKNVCTPVRKYCCASAKSQWQQIHNMATAHNTKRLILGQSQRDISHMSNTSVRPWLRTYWHPNLTYNKL